MADKQYRLVVFDWEGTLSDTLGQLIDTVSAVAEELGYGKIHEQNARKFVGYGLVIAVKKLFPDLTEQQHGTILAVVQNAMAVHSSAVYLFPGAFALLKQLHNSGVLLAVATNCGEQGLKRTLQTAELTSFFTITRTASQAPPKPCPQMLEEIMAYCAIPPSQTLMVGDSPSDIEMAMAAGVDAVGVDFYEQQSDNLQASGAMQVFDDYSQLARFLQSS